MLREPGVRGARALLAQIEQELESRIAFGRRVGFERGFIGRDAMQAQLLQFAEKSALQLACPRLLAEQDFELGDGVHRQIEIGVESDFVQPAGDLGRRLRQLGARARIELYEQQIIRVGFGDQRLQRGIGDITAVPIGDAVNFNRLKQLGQAGGGHHRLRRKLGVAKQPEFAVRDPCCRYE